MESSLLSNILQLMLTLAYNNRFSYREQIARHSSPLVYTSMTDAVLDDY